MRMLVPLAAATAVLLSGCAHHAQGMHGGGMHGGMHGSMAGTPSYQMHQHMMGGMQQMQSMPLSGNVDKDFVRMMRMHHLQGIQMSQMELQRGSSPEVRQMAQKIIEQQQAEVRQFDEWLRRNP
ncbi:DUF305 domain-containing protein [Ramlibacter pallidus]|nr:DUF305 domain-containing protein [Ramlibacter pallidus]